MGRKKKESEMSAEKIYSTTFRFPDTLRKDLKFIANVHDLTIQEIATRVLLEFVRKEKQKALEKFVNSGAS